MVSDRDLGRQFGEQVGVAHARGMLHFTFHPVLASLREI